MAKQKTPIRKVIDTHVDIEAEHARLKADVLEKAKAWGVMVTLHDFDLGREESELRSTAAALIVFEAKHKIGSEHGNRKS